MREREEEIQVKGTAPFTEPSPPFPVLPTPPASPSLPQSDSREAGANDLWWFPSLVQLHVKKVKGATSVAGNEFPALYEGTGLCTC